MKIVQHMVTHWLIGTVLIIMLAGCGNDSSGGGAAAEEAILEAGIVSPSADITIGTGQTVEFHGYAANGQEPYRFLWDFDGARPDSDKLDPGFVTFTEEGVYTVTFLVTDANGVELSDSVVVMVNGQVFEPVVLADIVSPPANDIIDQNAAIVFLGAANGGRGPYTYQWDFDGAAPPSTLKNPGSVTFSTVGTYTVLFTVIDATGRTDSDLVTIAVRSPSGTSWVEVAAGGDHSAALRSDGTLWAWGANTYGQVGTGTTTDYEIPQRIGSATNWAAVALGTYHSVGLLSDGSLWAWGDNHRGQLGQGNTSSSYTPLRVGADRDWAAVAAGALHTAALKKDGTLWVWGANANGQVGTGDNDDHTTPRKIGSGHTWVDVAAGAFHTLALRSDRTIWAWGKGYLNVPTQISLADDWEAMAGGYSSSVAIKTDGTLWSWTVVPVRVGTGSDWVAPVASGRSHSAVLNRDGSLWTWGSNLSGQLGTGGTGFSALPIQVGLDRNWTFVAAGYDHTIALRADGTMWAWGLNSRGQLGDGTFVSSNTPVRIR